MSNKYIDIMREIQRMHEKKYIHATDAESVKSLYEMILDKSSDKNAFTSQSADALRLLKKGSLTDEQQKAWLAYADAIFSSILAVKLYEDRHLATPDEAKEMIEYFRWGNFHAQVRAFGLYACAQIFDVLDPVLCYQLTWEALTIDPDLGKVIDVDYRFEGKAAEETVTETCPICGSDDVAAHYCSPQLRRLNKDSVFPPAKLWIKCNSCENYYTYNFPLGSVGLINGHYTKPQEDEVLENRFNLDNYNNIFGRLRELSEGDDYLEIGVGCGEMMAVAQEFGFQVEGVEICKPDAERISAALNVPITWCDVVGFETDKQYDVIIMGDVFEHVTDPVKVLKKAESMLKDSGVLWISTPNYNCAYARMQKFKHVMWHEKNHYTYVSRETMEKLLNDLGMKIVHYDMSGRYIGSMELFVKKF